MRNLRSKIGVGAMKKRSQNMFRWRMIMDMRWKSVGTMLYTLVDFVDAEGDAVMDMIVVEMGE
jgi:hypothetical protein